MKTTNLLKSIFACIVLGVSLIGCKDAGCEVNPGIGENQITFSSNISLTPLRVQDNKWDANDLIKVYMLKSGVVLNATTKATDILYEGVTYKAKSAGLKVDFEPASPADRMYFPTSGNVDFVAFYPTSLNPSAERTIALDVATNPVDLLYSHNAKEKNRATVATDLLLTFKHALSAIRVSLLDANNSPITNATVKVQGFKTQATFALADGSLSNLQGTAVLSLPLKNQTYDGIVLPQPVVADAVKFLIEYNGKNYEYVIPAITYEQGRRVSYTLRITEKAVEAVVSGEITDWIDVEGGEATLTPVNPSAGVSSFSVSKSAVQFKAEGGSEVLTITTDAQSFTATSSESWLTVSADVSAGTVTLTATSNMGAERNATVTLQHNGKLRAAPQTITVTVSQEAASSPKPKVWDGGISKIRDAFKAGKTTIESETVVEAMLINSIKENNNSLKNLIVSDGKAGIAIRLVQDASPSIQEAGTVFKITIPAGTKLQLFRDGVLQLILSNANLQVLPEARTLEPIEVTFADLMSDRINDDLESRLVRVNGVQFKFAGKPFADTKGNKYHTIVENSSTKAVEGFNLPGVFASMFNKWNLTIPEGNGSIVGATSFSMFGKKKTCNLFVRSAEDIQLNGPRR